MEPQNKTTPPDNQQNTTNDANAAADWSQEPAATSVSPEVSVDINGGRIPVSSPPAPTENTVGGPDMPSITSEEIGATIVHAEATSPPELSELQGGPTSRDAQGGSQDARSQDQNEPGSGEKDTDTPQPRDEASSSGQSGNYDTSGSDTTPAGTTTATADKHTPPIAFLVIGAILLLALGVLALFVIPKLF